jgi:hypothetical protein
LGLGYCILFQSLRWFHEEADPKMK